MLKLALQETVYCVYFVHDSLSRKRESLQIHLLLFIIFRHFGNSFKVTFFKEERCMPGVQNYILLMSVISGSQANQCVKRAFRLIYVGTWFITLAVTGLHILKSRVLNLSTYLYSFANRRTSTTFERNSIESQCWSLGRHGASTMLFSL